MRYSRSNSTAGISPPSSSNPSSASMHHTPSAPALVRKRTLQDSMHHYDGDLSGDSSSPHSSLPSFEFDAVHTDSPAYSVSTLDSSPMGYCHSASSYGDSASEYDIETNPDYLETRMGRPELKRRRTAPDVMASPSTPTRWEQESPTDKRGNGKDGQDVWPADVEDAFHTALRIIPKLGRKKVMVGGKPCGRNELIADYIRRNTGKIRSRKQVSSHIQVLKNMRKGDAEFMNLVSEPLEGDDTFAPGAALAFFGLPDPNSSPPHRALAGQHHQPAESLLSPYRPSFLQRSGSSSSSLSESFVPHSPVPHSAPMSATSSLTNAMKDMHFPIPPSDDRRNTCPIAPVAFCLWADDMQSDAMHVFTELEPRRGATGPANHVYLEDLSTAEREFPGLSEMFDHLPCQFLHTRLNLNVPTTREGAASAPQLHTSLKLTSLQDFHLTCVTRIFSFGHEVLSLSEELDRPTRIIPSARTMTSSSTHSSPASGLDSPQTAGSSLTGSPPVNPLRHKYAYNAPFASDFWSIFLRGSFSSEGGKMLPDFSKTGEERAAFVMAISGMSVIQEFVVRSEELTAPLVNGKDISAGSALGDVVLVVTYDFECTDDPSSGTATVAFLSAHKSPPPPSALSRMRSDSLTVHPPPPTIHHSSPTHAPNHHRASHSPTKPNLSLRIPPPAQYNVVACSTPGAGPLTPWPQMMHTPSAPPPVHDSVESAIQQERLGRIWARDSNEWELNSPALLGNFPGSHVPLTGLPNGSQAMADLTSKAIVAGTPTLSSFPPHATHSSSRLVPQSAPYGSPFIHPSHNYSVKTEEDYAVTSEDEIRIKAEDVEVEEVEVEEDLQVGEQEDKKMDIQDYFSSLLGGTPSKYTVKAES